MQEDINYRLDELVKPWSIRLKADIVDILEAEVDIQRIDSPLWTRATVAWLMTPRFFLLVSNHD